MSNPIHPAHGNAVAVPVITKPSELLAAAKAVIADREHWTIGALARDAENDPVSSERPEAICWCSIGALTKVTPVFESDWNGDAFLLNDKSFNYLCQAVSGLGVCGVATFNDTHSHAEVMAMWDGAITLARADESEEGS